MDIIKYVLFDFSHKEDERQKLFVEAREKGKKVIILNGIRNVRKWYETL